MEEPTQPCDVLNQERWKQFQPKRVQWAVWLNGDDQNSIWRQLTSLLWDYGLFSAVNQLRLESAKKLRTDVGFNLSVLRLLDAGFVATQATGIRRLVDKGSDVISLRRILYDIKRNNGLLTREIYLACRQLPYDHAAAEEAWIKEQLAAGTYATFQGLDTSGPSAFDVARMAHEWFDKLSGVDPASRSREDRVSPDLLTNLEKRIERCGDVKLFVDKFIAHAADTRSRACLTDNQNAVTLAGLEACLKGLYQVAAFIGGRLLQSSFSSGLPVPQFDLFENLEIPWATIADVGVARMSWDRFAEKVAKWESEPL